MSWRGIVARVMLAFMIGTLFAAYATMTDLKFAAYSTALFVVALIVAYLASTYLDTMFRWWDM